MTGYEKVGSCGFPSNWETKQTNIHLDSMNNTSDDIISLESERSETESEDHNPSRKKARFADNSSKICLRSTQLSNYSKGKSICKEPKSIDTGKRTINLDKNHPLTFVSGRRLVSHAEKEKAHQLALAFQSTKPSFLVTMVPSSEQKFLHDNSSGICGRPYAKNREGSRPLCSSWCEDMDGFIHCIHESSSWSEWRMEEFHLEQDDVCVFELTQLPGKKNLETISMDVKIFRVVKKLDKLTEAKQFLRMKQEEGFHAEMQPPLT
ncbi:hypothetical protein NE237_019809 [Protea cynaroides]|uniref:Uncharacterized protein n=1 Tax=Protea cynaroides TaxID=273540 RepID=A0A9Q0K125_9MAGN|nr:hypothetical protein NE237_019809 [Protea cynaroides]